MAQNIQTADGGDNVGSGSGSAAELQNLPDGVSEEEVAEFDVGAALESGEIGSFSDVPDSMLDDALNATGNIMGGFEKGAIKSGDLDAAKDAMILKTSVLEQQQSSDLADLSDVTDTVKPDPSRSANAPGGEESTAGLDQALGTKDVRNLIEECVPCLERPEILGGIDKALELSVRLFSNLLDRFTVLDDMIALVMPVTPYDVTCGVLNAMSSQCVPDLVKIILLLKFKVAISFKKIYAAFDFSSAKLSDLILLPIIIGLQAALCMVYDTILLPFECIVSSFYRQASKIPGAVEAVRHDPDNEGWDPDFGLDTFVEKLRGAKDEMYNQLEAFQHDFQAALCQTGFQANFVIDLLNDIKSLLAYISMIEQLIDIQSAKKICGIGEYQYNAADYYRAISDTIGDDKTKLNDDGNLIVFDDPPIDITPGDLEVLKDIMDTADDLWEDRTIQEDPDLKQTYTSLKNQAAGLRNIINTFGAGTARDYVNMGSGAQEDLEQLGESTDLSGLDGKMVVSIFNLRKCFERIANGE